MKQKLRKKAIKRYLQSETPKPIYSDLGRSKIGFSNGSGAIKAEIVAVTLIKPYHGKNGIAMDAAVTIDEEIGWEITLGSDLGNRKIHIPATGYPKVLDR